MQLLLDRSASLLPRFFAILETRLREHQTELDTAAPGSVPLDRTVRLFGLQQQLIAIQKTLADVTARHAARLDPDPDRILDPLDPRIDPVVLNRRYDALHDALKESLFPAWLREEGLLGPDEPPPGLRPAAIPRAVGISSNTVNAANIADTADTARPPLRSPTPLHARVRTPATPRPPCPPCPDDPFGSGGLIHPASSVPLTGPGGGLPAASSIRAIRAIAFLPHRFSPLLHDRIARRLRRFDPAAADADARADLRRLPAQTVIAAQPLDAHAPPRPPLRVPASCSGRDPAADSPHGSSDAAHGPASAQTADSHNARRPLSDAARIAPSTPAFRAAPPGPAERPPP